MKKVVDNYRAHKIVKVNTFTSGLFVMFFLLIINNSAFAQNQQPQQLPPPGALFSRGNVEMPIDNQNPFWEREFLEGGAPANTVQPWLKENQIIPDGVNNLSQKIENREITINIPDINLREKIKNLKNSQSNEILESQTPIESLRVNITNKEQLSGQLITNDELGQKVNGVNSAKAALAKRLAESRLTNDVPNFPVKSANNMPNKPSPEVATVTVGESKNRQHLRQKLLTQEAENVTNNSVSDKEKLENIKKSLLGDKRFQRQINDGEVKTVASIKSLNSINTIHENSRINNQTNVENADLLISGAPLKTSQKVSWLNYSPSGKLLAIPVGVRAQIINLATGETVNSDSVINSEDKIWFSQFNTAPTINDFKDNSIFESLLPTGNSVRSNIAAMSPTLKTNKKSVEVYPMDSDLAGALTGDKTPPPPLSAQALGNPLLGHQSFVYGVAFYPDGSKFVSGGGDAMVRVWDVATSLQYGSPLEGHSGLIYTVAVSNDARVIASAGADQTIRMWDANTGQLLFPALVGHTGEIYTLKFSPKNNWLFSAGADGIIRVWDAGNGSLVGGLNGHSQAIYALAFSPDGKYLASAGAENKIIIWDVEKGQAVKEITKIVGNIYSLAFTPKGDILASAGGDSQVHLWNMTNFAEFGAPFYTKGSALFSLAISPDGTQVAAGGFDNNIWLWDIYTGKANPVSPINGHGSWVTTLAFNPSGQFLVSGSADGSLRMWKTPENIPANQALKALQLIDETNTKDNNRIAPINVNTHPLQSINLNNSPNTDNNIVFARSPNGSKWVVAKGKEILQYDSVTNRLENSMQYQKNIGESFYTAVAYSPRANIIVAGTANGKFATYNSANGKLLNYLPYAVVGAIKVIAISESEEWIALANEEGEVRVYRNLNIMGGGNVNPLDQTWLPTYTFIAHTGKVLSLAFIGNNMLVSGGEDTNINLYNLQTGLTMGKAYEGQFSPVVAIAVAPNNREMVTGGQDGSVQKWGIDINTITKKETLINSSPNLPINSPTNLKKTVEVSDFIDILKIRNGQTTNTPPTLNIPTPIKP